MPDPGRSVDPVEGYLRDLGAAPVPADLASAVAEGVRAQGGRRNSSTPCRALSALAAVLVTVVVGGALIFVRAPVAVVGSPSPSQGTVSPSAVPGSATSLPTELPPMPTEAAPPQSAAGTDEAWAECAANLSQFTNVEGSAVVGAYRVTGAQYEHWRDDMDARGHGGSVGPHQPIIPAGETADVCFMDGFFAVPGGTGLEATRAVIVIVGGVAQLWIAGPKEGLAVEDPSLSVWPSPGPVGDGLDQCQSSMPAIVAALPAAGDLVLVAGFNATAAALANRQESGFVGQELDYQSAWRQRAADSSVVMCYLNGSLQTRSEQAAGTSRETGFAVLLHQDQVVVDSYGPDLFVTDPRGWETPRLGLPIRSDFTTVQLPLGGGQSLRLRIDHGAFQPYFVNARPATAAELAAVSADQLGPIGASNLIVVHPGGDLFSVLISWQGSCDTDDRLTISMQRDTYALDQGPQTACTAPATTRAVVLKFNKHSQALDALVEFHPGVVN